ncbi:M1 family metallopeptidase [soil metagenome]
MLFRSVVLAAVLTGSLAVTGCVEQNGASPRPGADDESHAPSAGGSSATPGSTACPEAPEYPSPRADRTRYSLALRVPSGPEPVSGRLRVIFRPNRPTSRLVFRLWANGPRQSREGAHLTVGAVTAGGRRVPAKTTDPTTLVVDPGRRLAAGDRIAVALPFSLKVPGTTLDRLSRHGTSLRLGSFFPLLAWDPDSGWITEPATSSLAESSVSPTADFDVTIHTPAGVQVLATGREVAPGRWRARAVRDFAIATGKFDLASRTLDLGRPVQVTVGIDSHLGGPPGPFLTRLGDALVALADRYGPYPWPTFSLAVQPDLGGAGIEYPNLVFQGPTSLANATSHEAGHQWFYSLVGNDQATDPWLDESLATWVGGRQDKTLDFFRSVRIPRAAKRHLGAGMGYWDRFPEDTYFAGVYAQGLQALAELGRPAKVDCALRLYAATNAYSIAEPSDLVDALARIFPDASRVLASYGVRD